MTPTPSTTPRHHAIVRHARAGDAVGLHLVAAATFPLACTPETPSRAIKQFVDEKLGVEHFRAHLESPHTSVFIAEVNGTPAGYALLQLAPTTDPDVLKYLVGEPSVELSKFYLLAGRHGSGLADELMRAAIAEARDHGAESLWLGVGQRNDRANSFYDRFDFERRGPKSFLVGDHVEADLVRELMLTTERTL